MVILTTVRFSEPFWCCFGLLGLSDATEDFTGLGLCCLRGSSGNPGWAWGGLSVGEGVSGPVGQESTFHGCLLVWLPINHPLQWCWAYLMLPDNLLFNLGEWTSLLGCLLLLGCGLGNGGSGCLLLLDGDTRCLAVGCASGSRVTNQCAFLPHFRVLLRLLLELFPGFIVALCRGGAGRWIYTILSRLES